MILKTEYFPNKTDTKSFWKNKRVNKVYKILYK